MAEFPAPTEGIAITHFIVSRDVERLGLVENPDPNQASDDKLLTLF